MVKTTIIVTALLVLLFGSLHAEEESKGLDALNGYDWAEWSPVEKVRFVQGGVLLAWSTLVLLIHNDVIIPEELIANLNFYPATDTQIAVEIDEFYKHYPPTVPLYQAIYLRNIWKESMNDGKDRDPNSQSVQSSVSG